MKIAVDIDGVLLDLIGRFCNIYNKEFNTNKTAKDITRWEFFKDWKVSEELIYAIFHKAYKDSMSLPLIDESAPRILKELNKKHHVDLVTARNIDFKQYLLERLNSLDIKKGIHYRKLIHVETKPYDLKLQLNHDIIIDDNPNLVESIIVFNYKTLLLYDQPWNQNLKENGNVKRVYNWSQIRKLINI